jgi:pimeloyl-ACP methyl ester carboxylesterase
MKTIYCISGLGADDRAFSKLNIPGYTLNVIHWLVPEPGETLAHFATRMREKITDEHPILMGLSFGGMLCTEIARQIEVDKIIIISSVKSSAQLPAWMKTVAALKLDKIVPLKSTKLTQPFQNKVLGVQSDEEKKLAASYRREVNPQYLKWAVNQAINWKNNWHHPKIYQIHGDKDYMFPIKNIKPDYLIKGGGHFMIMNRANEVSDCILDILKK